MSPAGDVVCTGDAIMLQACVLTGIPGGIDYFLQVLEGEVSQ